MNFFTVSCPDVNIQTIEAILQSNCSEENFDPQEIIYEHFPLRQYRFKRRFCFDRSTHIIRYQRPRESPISHFVVHAASALLDLQPMQSNPMTQPRPILRQSSSRSITGSLPRMTRPTDFMSRTATIHQRSGFSSSSGDFSMSSQLSSALSVDEPGVMSTLAQNNVDCCICLEEMKRGCPVLMLNCTHIFHPKCLRGWLQSKKICPICRHQLI